MENVEPLLVRLRAIVPLHRTEEKTDWGRPGDIIRMPFEVALPLVHSREAEVVNQYAQPTREY
jgi:hypothetical protein